MNSAGFDGMRGGLRASGVVQKRSLPGFPLVSIVTVVLNGAAHIEQAISSVLAQSYRNVEYIVIDGGSTDGTLEILRRYSDRIDYWVSERDRGIYAAMNKGLELAQGEVIGLLNADDFYEPGALAAIVAAYCDTGAKGIYYGDNYVLQDDLALKYRKHASLCYWMGMSICHQAMFVHREVYREVGWYREKYRFAADYDFLLRAVAAQVELLHVPSYLVNYRDTGLTSRHYAASLNEAKWINRDFFGRFSRRHAGYLASYCKTLVLHLLEKLVLRICGRPTLDRLRNFYLRKVLLSPSDIIY